MYYTVDCIWHKDEKQSKSKMQGIVSVKIMATHRNRKCMAILAMDSGGNVYQCDWYLPTIDHHMTNPEFSFLLSVTL